MPTNITCTASDVLANCIPIRPETKSASPHLTNVTVMPRENFFDEIMRNGPSLGIDISKLKESSKLRDDSNTSAQGVENSIKRSSKRDSLRSTTSSINSVRTPRPRAPPPPPPSETAPRQSLRPSRSEGDLLGPMTSLPAEDKEAMMQVEYAELGNEVPRVDIEQAPQTSRRRPARERAAALDR